MDEGRFLRAILEDPDDTGLRLVFADWLDEHGQPQRAEFIRVECEAASLPESDPRRQQRRERALELLDAHGRQWFGPVAKLVENYGTRRGFVEDVELSAARFVKHARAIFALAPVRDVFVTRHATQLRAFAQCPGLANLTALKFCDANEDEGHPVYPMGARGAFLLTASPHLGNLRELSLPWNFIGPAGMEALAASRRLNKLTSFGLSGNDVGDRGAVALAPAKHLGSLTELDLHSNGIGEEGALALAGSPRLGNLRRLELGGNPIGEAGRQALRERFGKKCVRCD